MRIIFTGRGTSGSWKIRGSQLAHALGAEAIPNAIHSNADVVVVVKKVEDRTLRAFRSRKIVYDIVDAWPQPAGNEWSEGDAHNWLAREMERIKPDAVIAATRKMAEDVRSFGVPVLWLKHHHRPGIRNNPIREQIKVIGYEGSPSYIVRWHETIKLACGKIGATFTVNPETLADCDVVLALRDARGYAPQNWKSGVKLSNAHGSGTPWIGCTESGYTEIATGCEYWADNGKQLFTALEWLAAQSTREQIHDRFVQAAYPVEKAATDLRLFLEQQFG